MTTQTLFGVIDANGIVVSGSGGFSAQNLQRGVYSISFNTPFSSPPAIVASQGGNFFQPDPRDCAAVGNLTLQACIVITGDGAGNRASRQFSFIAIGTL